MRDPNLDYYAVLGVHPGAEDIVIRAAYKALAQRYHPDRYAGSKDEAHRRMSDLTKAYEVLADPLRRPKYDRRRSTHAQSVAATYYNSPKYGTPTLDPGEAQSVRGMRQKSRVALAALMIVVAILSAFNIYHYSKAWLDATAAVAPSLPVGPGRSMAVEAAPPKGQPSLPLDPVPAAAPATDPAIAVAPPEPCRDVVAALGLCRPNITAKKK